MSSLINIENDHCDFIKKKKRVNYHMKLT
jgi:hypothetical protein